MPDTTWLSTVYGQFSRELLLAAWTVLRRSDLAEDAVQAAFVRLVQLNKRPVDPKLYVFRSVRNAAIDMVKARSRRREEPLRSDWDAPTIESGLPDTNISRQIADLLEQLDARSREVIELHLQAGLTFQEVAEIVDEPLATVASRYRRGLAKIGSDFQVRYD